VAKQVLTNARLYAAGYDLSGAIASMAFQASVDAKDVTGFGETGRRFLPGLERAAFQHEGFFDADVGQPDPVFWSQLNLAGQPMAIVPAGPAVDGQAAYTMLAVVGAYTPLQGGNVGEPIRFSVSGQADGPLARGVVALSPTVARTASGNGAAQSLGLLAAGRRLTAQLHVLGISGAGATFTAAVQSDDAVGFPSPTTRLTFAPATAIGAQQLTLDGPIATDTFWRINFTIAGTTPSVIALITLGIQ
jgi:hypothetical protein